MTEHNPGLTKREQDVYTSTMREGALKKQLAVELFDLPCACQNLRRVTRIVTRIYDQELRKAGLEITQFGLLTALATTGEANQKRLSAGFAMDSTTLTRTLGLLRRQGWVRVRRGKDRLFHPVATAERTWRYRVEKHEADGLANYSGRDGGVNVCTEYRCIYI